MAPVVANFVRTRNTWRGGVVLALAVGVVGCSSPRPQVEPPETVRAPEYPEADPNGAIYQPRRGSMALFEDWSAGGIGDVITVVLEEQVSASKNSSSNASRNGSISFDPETMPESLETVLDYALGAAGESEFSGSGGSEANNTFDGTITVTVREVLPNGNLRVAGEKQIAINQGTEFIRFSGIVHPRSLNGQNRVTSTEVASARIEYLGDGYIAESQRMGWLQRTLLWLSPF